MILLSFIIPLCLIFIGVFFFKKEFRLEELGILALISILTITGSYYAMKNSSLDDVEYNGYFVVEARYYEPYTTWVDETCTRQVASGKDSDGNTTYTTETYDCSYCKRVSASYEIEDNGGNVYSISREKYYYYIKLWNHKAAEFVELNRDIDTHFSCGVDGDMYKVNWDKSVVKSMTVTKEITYKNILKTNKSAFNYSTISKESALSNKLYEYPEIIDDNQSNIFDLNRTKLNAQQKRYISKRSEYLNGSVGKTNLARVYYLIFVDQPADIAILQESYWEGGNRNEINICIGTDTSGNIQWVYPFSWTKNKRVIVDIREDLIKAKNIKNINEINGYVKEAIKTNYKYRNFDDFSYLEWEPSVSQILWIYFIIFVVSLTSFIFMITNDFKN